MNPNSYDYWGLSDYFDDYLWTKFRKVSFWMSTIPSVGDYTHRFPMLNDKYSIIKQSELGNLQMVKWLTEKWNADIDTIHPEWGWTSLLFSAWLNHLNVVKFLVESDAEPDFQDNCGYTALMISMEFCHLDVVKYLLENGADPILENNEHQTALDLIPKTHFKELFMWLWNRKIELKN